MGAQEDYNHAYAAFVGRVRSPESGHGGPTLPGLTQWSATKSSLREEGIDEDIIEAAELQLLSRIDLRCTAELLIDRVALPHDLAHGGVAPAQIIQALRAPLAAMGEYAAPDPDGAAGQARQALIESVLDSVLSHTGPGCIQPFDDAQVAVVVDLCVAAWERLGLDASDLTTQMQERATSRGIEREWNDMALDFD